MELHQQNPKMDLDFKDLNNAFKRFKEHAEFMFKGPLVAKREEIQV